MRKDKENVLNEKDSLTDILTGQKNLIKLYSTTYTEAVGKGVRQKLKANMFELAEEQLGVFQLMEQNGYYELQPADKAVIAQKMTDCSKILKAVTLLLQWIIRCRCSFDHNLFCLNLKWLFSLWCCYQCTLNNDCCSYIQFGNLSEVLHLIMIYNL